MDEHFKKIPIPEGHTLVAAGLEWKGARKGRDTDIYFYNELNAAGEVVASYEVTDSMSTYPPFSSSISVSKVKGSGE
ncbi:MULTISPECIES: hypothetical protein [Pseudomonas]|uniref:hypothetical protein n=1 Tax=Pseudomonas TaxID=286 RepID=UPI000CFE8AC8|nr:MULTISPECIES: hypothetical protein [Pseudomonas]PRA53214.1 hypothetical protein CQZ98_14375 [Pseudomonas sp. MYb115]QXN52182.1 hypothetical protein KW062_10780 [Pseudomonas fluorescens]WSO26511.1 hypothetical protein VUJ50_10840 [Pseudomonas fluorescens]